MLCVCTWSLFSSRQGWNLQATGAPSLPRRSVGPSQFSAGQGGTNTSSYRIRRTMGRRLAGRNLWLKFAVSRAARIFHISTSFILHCIFCRLPDHIWWTDYPPRPVTPSGESSKIIFQWTLTCLFRRWLKGVCANLHVHCTVGRQKFWLEYRRGGTTPGKERAECQTQSDCDIFCMSADRYYSLRWEPLARWPSRQNHQCQASARWKSHH